MGGLAQVLAIGVFSRRGISCKKIETNWVQITSRSKINSEISDPLYLEDQIAKRHPTPERKLEERKEGWIFQFLHALVVK